MDKPQTPQAVGQRSLLAFEVVQTGQPGLALIGVSGTLSRGTGFDDLTNEIIQSIRNGQKHVVLDLQHVTYINSSGVSGLIGLRNKIAADGGTISMVNPQPQVATVLANLNLLKVFNCTTKPIQSG
jgi:anti-anti-sigma factor